MTQIPRSTDERARLFGPLGLGGPAQAEDSAAFYASLVERFYFGQRVPPEVANQFEKAKLLFLDGLFSYANFTHAEREAYRVLEAALKTRFLEHYRDGVPLLVDGAEQRLTESRFDAVHAAVTRKGARLTGHSRFDASLTALLSWARQEGYFYGQHNRIRESVTPRLRNHLLHSEADLLLMPPDTFHTLRVHFEWIQRLWGYFTPGGVAYPGPVPRRVRVIARSRDADQMTDFLLDDLDEASTWADGNGSFDVVLATDRTELWFWQDGYETTPDPVRHLWGPGSCSQLVAAVADLETEPDEIDLLDRVFFVQVLGESIAPARSAEQLLAVRSHDQGEGWYAVKADRPDLAQHHLRELLQSGKQIPAEHSSDGPCRSCAADVQLSRAHWDTARARAVGVASSVRTQRHPTP
jgi:hypothetical protein